MPGTGHAGDAGDAGHAARVERAAQVGAVVREHADGIAAAHGEQAQVTELPADRPSFWQFGERAQVVPAERGEVTDGLGVARPRAKPQREVAAQA